jgi:hypothetical protein
VPNATLGAKCPYCGVRWNKQVDEYGNTTATTAGSGADFSDFGFLGACCVGLAVVGVKIFVITIIIRAIRG